MIVAMLVGYLLVKRYHLIAKVYVALLGRLLSEMAVDDDILDLAAAKVAFAKEENIGE